MLQKPNESLAVVNEYEKLYIVSFARNLDLARLRDEFTWKHNASVCFQAGWAVILKALTLVHVHPVIYWT